MKAIIVLIGDFFSKVRDFIGNSNIAKFFLLFMIIVLILNIIKSVIIIYKKKKIIPDDRCRYLKKNDCIHPIRKEFYSKNNNRCKGCKGRTLTYSLEEIEDIVSSSGEIEKIVITSAGIGKALLPYLSFLFTVLVAIFENTK